MNIAWFIIFLVIFIFGQSYLYAKKGLKKLTYRRHFDKETVFVGQDVILIDQIINQKLLPIPWVRLESKMDQSIQVNGKVQFDHTDSGVYRTLLSLLPYQKLTRRHHFTVTKRGVFELDTINLTIGDMFGFDEIFSSFETDAKIIVYPTLLDHDQLTLPAQNFLGEQSVKRWINEDPFLTVGTRDYEAGDSIAQINWKATARTKNIQVKVNDYTADREPVIVINGDQSDDIWFPIVDQQLFEQSISQAATVAHFLEGNGESYSLATNIVDARDRHVNHRPFINIEAGNGSPHFYHILTQLAYLVPERSRHFKYLLDEIIDQRKNRCDILLITPIMTSELLVKIEQLRKAGHTVTIDHIIAGQEREVV